MAQAKFALVLIPMDPKQGYGSEDLISALKKNPEVLGVARVVTHPEAIADPEALAYMLADEARSGLTWLSNQITPDRMVKLLGLAPASEPPKK